MTKKSFAEKRITRSKNKKEEQVYKGKISPRTVAASIIISIYENQWEYRDFLECVQIVKEKFEKPLWSPKRSFGAY